MTDQKLFRKCEIPIPLTFHVARHTFAKTVALKNGIPLETVQLMMGYTKITTQIYADVDKEKILDDMSGLEKKLEKKRGIVIEKWQKERNHKCLLFRKVSINSV